ncbi:hypothetical protein HOLleu_38945 [Holothuria leucospilota]|uniref:FLYWCH-type domain-containing protein n=1 Tax=Holothuria leucospilota TaxID=206669 RepID=A0A9Q0YFE8_HOLLE|nr:hypothetical protein HOLleu_38945 [Holothuria leucospilota]
MSIQDRRTFCSQLGKYGGNSQEMVLHPIEELALSSRGRGFIINGYVYVRDKERPGKMYVRCQDRKICQARAVIFPDLNRARVMPTSHTHSPPDISQMRNKKRFHAQRNLSDESTLRMRTQPTTLYTRNSMVDKTRRNTRPMDRAYEARVVPITQSAEYSVKVQIEEQELLESFRRNTNSVPCSSAVDLGVDDLGDEIRCRKPNDTNAEFDKMLEVAGPSSGGKRSVGLYPVSEDYEPYEDGFIPEDEDEEELKPVTVQKVQVEPNTDLNGISPPCPIGKRKHAGSKEFQ